MMNDDYYAYCDICGTKELASRMQLTKTSLFGKENLFVCLSHIDELNPQEEIKHVKEDRQVPVARPNPYQNDTAVYAPYDPTTDNMFGSV